MELGSICKRCLGLVGKEIDLDAVDRQFQSYCDRRMHVGHGGALMV